MAAQQVLFKIACPSCDAQVPIRDQRNIGKKMECPKCKFKFVVDEPGDEGDDEPKVKKARPKKKASNKNLMIGLSVGGAAVVVLGVVAYFLFFNNSDKPKTSPPTNPPVATNAPRKDPLAEQPANTAATEPKDKTAADKPANADQPVVVNNTSAAPVAPAGTAGDITNLLPNDAQLVVNIWTDKLRFCTLGEQLFESKIGFRHGLFKEKIGFGIEDIKRFVRAENTEQKWSFNVMEMMKPVTVKELESAMHFKKGANSPIKGREYYEIPANDVLDNLAAGVKTELEARGDRLTKAGDSGSMLGLALVDETTLVIATVDQLKHFLQADCKPRHQSKPAKPLNDQDIPGGGAGGGDGPKPRGGRSFSYSFGAGMMPDPQAPGDPNDPNLVELANYLTIDPPLKAMFDRLEPADPKNRPIMTVVMHMQADPKLRQRLVGWTGIPMFSNLPIKVFGLTLTKYELERFYGQIAAEFFNENDVKEIEAVLKKQLPLMAVAMGLYLGGIKIETEGADAVPQPAGGGGPGGGRPGTGGGGPPPQPGGLPGIPNIEDGPTSKLKLARKSHYLIVTAELNLVQRAFDKIYEMTASTVSKMRGMVDMAAKEPQYQLLVNAAMRLKEGGTIPRATYQLSEGTGGRLARNWPPHHRVSWMAALLPHMGYEQLYKNIDRDKPWRTENNLKAASILVPAFLDPRYPDQTWYAKMDALGNRAIGATHYVGMAGVGMEIADFNPALEKDEKRKAEMRKKMGVFGYDRETAIKDVTDGVSNTIFMLSVPPTYQRPWIAGGGATAQGAPENRSVRPFVHNHGGKKGTYVLMLDGTVRFIKEDISDDVFKALCTIQGGENIEELEKVAPKFKPGEAKMKTDPKDDEKEKEKDEKDQ